MPISVQPEPLDLTYERFLAHDFITSQTRDGLVISAAGTSNCVAGSYTYDHFYRTVWPGECMTLESLMMYYLLLGLRPPTDM